MRVLSLFDGAGMARQALKVANIPVEVYFASEIDQYAIAVARENHPDIVHIGDIRKVNGNAYKDIDLLIGGSPCQGFSFAGKQLNFDDPRSVLFFEFVRILKGMKPTYFLLENVKMSKCSQEVITEQLGMEPIEINSALVSAQNRRRLYWTNIPNVSQPEDRQIVLSDIIENGAVDRIKSYVIDANYFKGGNLKSYFEKHRRQIVFIASRQVDRRITTGGKRADYDESIERVQWIEVNKDPAKTNNLSTVAKDNILVFEKENFRFRKLSILECERLQTLPGGYTEAYLNNGRKVSDTQRYKMIGNGFTVAVIAHILGYINLGDVVS